MKNEVQRGGKSYDARMRFVCWNNGCVHERRRETMDEGRLGLSLNSDLMEKNQKLPLKHLFKA